VDAEKSAGRPRSIAPLRFRVPIPDVGGGSYRLVPSLAGITSDQARRFREAARTNPIRIHFPIKGRRRAVPLLPSAGNSAGRTCVQKAAVAYTRLIRLIGPCPAAGGWGGSVSLLGPIFVREWQTVPRRPRHYMV